MVTSVSSKEFPYLGGFPTFSPWSYLPDTMHAEVMYEGEDGCKSTETVAAPLGSDKLVIDLSKGVPIEINPYLPVWFSTDVSDLSIVDGGRALGAIALNLNIGLRGNDYLESFEYFWEDMGCWEQFHFEKDRPSHFVRQFVKEHPEREERIKRWPRRTYTKINSYQPISERMGFLVRDVKLIWPATNIEASLEKCLG